MKQIRLEAINLNSKNTDTVKKPLNLIKEPAELAREVCNVFNDKPRYVIGSMGPTGYLPSSDDPDLGQKSLDEIQQAFVAQAKGLILDS